jgi:tetratricopeptide (TPR) repeat protein
MPSTLPPAYVCIYCSDVSCRCRCLYCGESGHNTKLCNRRLQHTMVEQRPAAAAPPGGARAHVHVRYSQEIDGQARHVAAKVIQGVWRGHAVRERNRYYAPLHSEAEMGALDPYGEWERRTRWQLFGFRARAACVAAATCIEAWVRGWLVRRRRQETTRAQILAALHRDVWQLKLWAARPTPAWRPLQKQVEVQLSVGGGAGAGAAAGWVCVELVVAPELLRQSAEHRFATHIQKRFRGYITRKWHGMMSAMLMLPGQGGIDSAVEKYGFRIIGLLQELQRRERKLGLGHPDTADVLYNMGRLYQQHGDLDLALGAFARALRTYKATLGPGHPKSGNLLYCIALIYKERAEGPELSAQVHRAFGRVDREGTGSVPVEELEALLSKLFESVDLSLCAGPQTVVALLLEVSEAEDLSDAISLSEGEFEAIFRRCFLVVAEGYFRTAARSFSDEYGADYEFAVQAVDYADACRGLGG